MSDSLFGSLGGLRAFLRLGRLSWGSDWHLAVCLGLEDLSWGVPDEEAALGSSSDYELLVRGHSDLKRRG